MSAPGLGFEKIRDELIARIASLAAELVPDGKKKGKYWIGRNPRRADEHAGSFWILLEGQAAGAWRDEAGVRGVDDGDVVKLVQYCRGLKDLADTRRECLRWLGWANGAAPEISPAEKARLAAERKAKLDKAEQQEAERRKKGGSNALGLWLKADMLKPDKFVGSLLETYFLSRAIDLSSGLLARQRPLPGALRFFASHDYHTADGEVLEGFPCMAALMSGPAGQAQALHRTWLRPDGGGKADLPDPDENGARKIWGPPNGAVIRIAKGAKNLTPEEAEKRAHKGPLIVTEGIEDALAVTLAMPEHRVWAAGTLGNIGNIPVLPCISTITVCRDNDWEKPQAVKSFERAIAQLKKSGRPVFVARSPKGKDMNDLLKGEKI